MQLRLLYCFVVCVFMLGTGVLGQDSSVTQLMQTPTTGSGTYYGYSGSGGECTLDGVVPPVYGSQENLFFSTVAMVTSIYAGSMTCGACLNVTSLGTGSGSTPLPSGSMLVFVNNECPSCNSGGLDFGLNGKDGAWGISWKLIECPLPASNPNIQYFFAPGCSDWYLKIQIRNTRVPAYQFYLTQGSSEVQFVKTSDNFFSPPPGFTYPVTTPLQIRIVSVEGDSISDTISQITSDNIPINSQYQFPAHSSYESSGTSTSSSTSGSATSSGNTASSGNTVASSGGVAASSGSVTASSGNTAASSGGVAASSGGVAASSGNAAATSGNADSNSDTSTSTTGSCPIGSLRCHCTVGGTCDKGLTCLSKYCVDVSSLQSTASSSFHKFTSLLLWEFLLIASLMLIL